MIGWTFSWLMEGAGIALSDFLVVAFALSSSSAATLPDNPDRQGIASRFGDPGDKWIGGNLKCKPDERVSTTEHQCAVRNYSCGTILIVENKRTGKKSWCEVVDAGPYGANVFAKDSRGRYTVPVYTEAGRKAWYVKRRRSHRPPDDLCPSGDCVGRWRGVIDLSPAVSDAIEHNGFERVRVWRRSRVVDHLRKVNRTTQSFVAQTLPGYSLESLAPAR